MSSQVRARTIGLGLASLGVGMVLFSVIVATFANQTIYAAQAPGEMRIGTALALVGLLIMAIASLAGK